MIANCCFKFLIYCFQRYQTFHAPLFPHEDKFSTLMIKRIEILHGFPVSHTLLQQLVRLRYAINCNYILYPANVLRNLYTYRTSRLWFIILRAISIAVFSILDFLFFETNYACFLYKFKFYN